MSEKFNMKVAYTAVE